MVSVVNAPDLSSMTSVFSSAASLANQRKSTRVAFKRRARFIGADGASAPVTTYDLCSDGISIICPYPLRENQHCELSIAANCDGVPTDLRISGRVVYCMLSGMLGFRAGIQFSGVDEKNRILIARVIARSIPI
jgi:hypothetical protein